MNRQLHRYIPLRRGALFVSLFWAYIFVVLWLVTHVGLAVVNLFTP